jgi:Flp pilus assembly protein TadG
MKLRETITAVRQAAARPFARFGRAREGTVAIEFAIVAVPFFGLMYAIFQTTLIFFAGQVFESAVADAARQIMTGNTKTFSATDFKNAVCAGVPAVFDCKNGILLDVRTYASYATAQATPPPLKDGVLDPTQFGFSTSGASQIVVVRAVYPFPVYMRPFGINMGNTDSGTNYMLIATAAFRNEPF